MGSSDEGAERRAQDNNRDEIGRRATGRQDQDPLQRRRCRHGNSDTAVRRSSSRDHDRADGPKTEGFLVADTKFWIVRPRISGANITGLGTLISGAYIGIEIGTSKEDRHGPLLHPENPGFRLAGHWNADLLPAAQVGQIASYELDKDGKFLTVQEFVQAPLRSVLQP